MIIVDKYIFPVNYKFQAKLLGIIEYRYLLPIAIYLGILIAILYTFKVDFFLSFGICIALGLPPILLLSVGVNGQSAVPYFMSIIRFKLKKQQLYLYNIR